MVEFTKRKRLIGRGVALVAVGAVFTITIIGAMVGVPMMILGIVFLLQSIFAGDSEGTAQST